MSLVLALLLTLAPAAQESVDVWFPRLESESWEERELAQRRLAGALQASDIALVRAALVAGGPETRLRLAHVLADEDRLFGTAAELAVDADEIVARAGTTALRLAIERFEPYALSEPIPREDLWSALAEHDGALIDAREGKRYAPTEIADLLALAQAGSPRIVFDIAATTGTGVRKPVEFGAWRELARSAAQQSGGRLVGFGVHREPAPQAVRWLAVVERAAEDADVRAGALVERWCLAFARAGDAQVRAIAARALCAHGMPSAVAWIAGRLRDTRDDAALEGLLLAARRGNVPAVLQEPFARELLWSELERAVHEQGSRAVDAARALAGVGLPRGEGSSAELARALANLDPASPRRAQLALVVLEGWSSARAPASIGSAVRGLLARADLPVALRFQCLRVAARLGIVEPLAGDPGLLQAAAWNTGHFDEFARLVRGVPGWPPDAWAGEARDGLNSDGLKSDGLRSDLQQDEAMAIASIDAWAARGALEPAARMLASLVASRPDATDRLSAVARLEPRLRDVVDRAAAMSKLSAADAATWRVLCGVATADERRERAAEFLRRDPASDAEWLALGALCAGPTGAGARERFVSAMPGMSSAMALLVAQRAVHALRADLEDPAERAFLQSVRGVVRMERGSPLDRAFRAEAWPPPPSAPAVRLSSFDRDPARGPR